MPEDKNMLFKGHKISDEQQQKAIHEMIVKMVENSNTINMLFNSMVSAGDNYEIKLKKGEPVTLKEVNELKNYFTEKMTPLMGDIYNSYSILSDKYKLGFDEINKRIQECRRNYDKNTPSAKKLRITGTQFGATSLEGLQAAIKETLAYRMVDESLLKKPGMLDKFKPFH